MSLKYALVYAVWVRTLVLGNRATQLARHLANGSSSLNPPPTLLNETVLNTTLYPSSLNVSLTSLGPPPTLLNGTLYSSSMLNESVTSLDVTGGNDIHVQCDGASYGFDLDIVDCEQGKAYIPASAEQFQWAERHTGWQKTIFFLPYRAMGDKALCYVQPLLIDGAISARASTNQVRNAAAAIRRRCASGGQLQGGIATNIGGDNHLAVIIAAYQPTSEIRCRGLFLPMESCENVLEDMPTTTETEVFGPLTDSTAQVHLPQAVQSDDTKCMLTIFGTSTTSDKTSWYDIWEATAAIWSVCVRHGLGGSLSGVGDNGNLLLTMTASSFASLAVAATNEIMAEARKKGPMALMASNHYGEARTPVVVVEKQQA